jgi:hypothetical protein
MVVFRSTCSGSDARIKSISEQSTSRTNVRLLINHAILDHALQLPVRTSVVIDIIEERTWFADVIDLDDKDWRASAMSYEASRLNTSPPAFSHYTMAYYAESSDDAVRQSISRFIAQAAVIRTNLEVAYRRR